MEVGCKLGQNRSNRMTVRQSQSRARESLHFGESLLVYPLSPALKLVSLPSPTSMPPRAKKVKTRDFPTGVTLQLTKSPRKPKAVRVDELRGKLKYMTDIPLELLSEVFLAHSSQSYLEITRIFPLQMSDLGLCPARRSHEPRPCRQGSPRYTALTLSTANLDKGPRDLRSAYLERDFRTAL